MKPIDGMATFLVIGFAAVFLLACENKMGRAKQALDEISYSVATTLADGKKYVPAETAHVQRELADLQGAYGKRNYAPVLSRAPAVLADAKSLAADAAAKKSQVAKALDERWSGFAATLPQWIVAVEDRVATLSKAGRVPKGLDLSTARAALADAKNGWGRAQAAMASGDFDDAIATAKDVKAKTDIAAAALKLELPAAG
jgi:hypothetical protein